MRIVVDLQACQSTSHRERGIGRYSLALAKALLRNAGEDEIWVALNGEVGGTIESIRGALSGLIEEPRIVVWRSIGDTALSNPGNGARHAAATQVRDAFLAQLRPDIVHVSSLFEGYLDNVTCSIESEKAFLTSVSLYDLIPLEFADVYLSDPRLRDWYMGRLGELKRADLILGISQYTCRKATELLQIPSARMVPVMAGVEPIFRPREFSTGGSSALLARHGIRRPFVMFTGGIDYRKNFEGLIKAYSLLQPSLRQGFQLVVVCEAHADQRQRLLDIASQQGLHADELVLTGYVSDADLVGLYNLCRAFVFPSLSEGFGFPPLEAMACGAAVIGSDASSIPEVIGVADALFDPCNPESMADRLGAVLTDDAWNARLRKHGLQRAQEFSWDRCAQTALAAMREACGRRRSESNGQRKAESADIKRKPRLAYVSPLPPERSGIADYSAELLPVLSDYYDIEVVIDQEVGGQRWREYVARSYAWFDRNAHCYDRVLYHMGNSALHAQMLGMLERHPGAVVLHEVFLSGVTSHLEMASKVPGYWTRCLYESHGYRALLDRAALDFEQMLERYPCSLPVIRDAEGIIVHNSYCREIADEWFGARTAEGWAVVPLMRVVPDHVPRNEARFRLGLGEEDLLVCCFGILGTTKRNREVLDSWFASALNADPRCRLVFVGGAHDPEYAEDLELSIAGHGASGRVRITGWVEPTVYREYLAAADVAVQLRGSSRGETSATVLDCLAHGLPVIVNAHGSMTELPHDAVKMIPDDFSHRQLADALECMAIDAVERGKLGERGRAYCRRELDPRRVAGLYHDAIERIASNGPHRALGKMADSIAAINLDANDLERLATGVAANQQPRVAMRQLLVDVSELVRRDAKSGIQRVVRSVLSVLLRQPPKGFRVEPVYANPGQRYRYARGFTASFLGLVDSMPADDPIDCDPGDVFLGLDLALDEIPANRAALTGMAERGVELYFVIYDQLPLQRSDCFPVHAYGLFNDWMKAIASLSNGLICISRAVEADVRRHLDTLQVRRDRPIKLGHFHLGADIGSSKPTGGTSREQELAIGGLRDVPSCLVVGTVEPRKGHAQTIDAFDLLWMAGAHVKLVLVGKPGWMTDHMTRRIREHAENGKRLLWFERASDELLQRLYDACTVLLAPSEAEGFGLPLIEASRHGMPILCRDLPVFREVAGEHASYFSGYAAADLAAAVQAWLESHKCGTTPSSKSITWMSWKQSTKRLLDVMLRDRWDGVWKPGACFRFAAYDSNARTDSGGRVRGLVVSDGSPGVIFQTARQAIPAGNYRLQLFGAWRMQPGTARVEIVNASTKCVFADFKITADVGRKNGKLLDTLLIINHDCDELEMRVVGLNDAHIEIMGCALNPISGMADDIGESNVLADETRDSESDDITRYAAERRTVASPLIISPHDVA